MKKVFLLLTAMLVILSVLVGCSQSADNSDTIKLGVNYELSGDVATYGRSSVEGIELAIEEINEAGGINGKEIEIIKYDNKSESEATTLTTRLMTQDKY